jgi:hypothetical protein
MSWVTCTAFSTPALGGVPSAEEPRSSEGGSFRNVRLHANTRARDAKHVHRGPSTAAACHACVCELNVKNTTTTQGSIVSRVAAECILKKPSLTLSG